MSTSNGSIPRGLSLYQFNYPVGDWMGKGQHEVYLQSDTEAIALGETYGATSIVHVVSGTELLTENKND